MTNNKKLLSGLAVGFATLVLTVFVIFKFLTGSSCVTETKTEIVRGSSMSPLIKDGEEVKALYGYYSCNEVKRNDIVLVQLPNRSEPLIKFVKALPGDKLEIRENDSGLWNIYINDKILINSQNTPYAVPTNISLMLRLYEGEYNGVMPVNLYLIFGDNPQGSEDSTRFGPIDGKAIVAKVRL